MSRFRNITRGVFSDCNQPGLMGASFLPVLLFSAIWGVVGVVLPFFVPRGPHKSVIQVHHYYVAGTIPVWLSDYVGRPDDHWGLLLAVLALLLHESDEPSDRASAGDQGALRHEAPVGRRRRLKYWSDSFNIPIVSVNGHCSYAQLCT